MMPPRDEPTRRAEDAIRATLTQLDEAVARLDHLDEERRRAAGIALGAARHNCHEALSRLRHPAPTTVRVHIATVGKSRPSDAVDAYSRDVSDAALEQMLDGCRAAHRRLRATLDRLDDDLARVPSRLPDWSVGHVLTHLARNAESHVRILRAALAGEHVEQYLGGAEQRNADIEAGAGRSAAALADDVARTAQELEDTWAAMTPEAWAGHGLSRGLPWPCRQLPFYRWREVEVHHVDLGVGYDIAEWPEPYVAAELPRVLAVLPQRITDAGARRRLLAWLLGRAGQPGDIRLEAWQSRPDFYVSGETS